LASKSGAREYISRARSRVVCKEYDPRVGVQVKGKTLRSYVSWLEREKKLEAIVERVPKSTAAQIRRLPLDGTWMDFQPVEDVLCALYDLDGRAGIRRMMKEEMRDRLLPPLMPMMLGLLRMFGFSPATVFRRMDDFCRTGVRGMKFQYTPTSKYSGVMEVDYALGHEVPLPVLLALMVMFEASLDLCDARGKVSDPERVGMTGATFRIAWEEPPGQR
jgi:hypothetical protein